MLRKIKIGLIQMLVTANKQENLLRAKTLIGQANKNKDLNCVVLPECFNSPYGNKYFKEYAEPIDGPTFNYMSELAKAENLYIIAGSIPEKRNDKYFNTSFVVNNEGLLQTLYSKMHLFDIDIPGKITFKESETLSPGLKFATFNIGAFTFGIGICYDLRFPELALIYTQKLGCHAILYPGAFNTTTGPPHWELLIRSRALDNQIYCAGISPARNCDPNEYPVYGHTLICDPWGKIVDSLGVEEGIIISELDLDYVEEVRKSIPISKQRRKDVYQLSF